MQDNTGIDCMDKDPASYSILTYSWVIVLSLLGGMSHYTRKLTSGSTEFNWLGFISEMMTSGFVGLLTFYLCEAANISPALTASLVGITGHMGSRAIFLMERRLIRLIEERERL